jgi:hypothetical protein
MSKRGIILKKKGISSLLKWYPFISLPEGKAQVELLVSKGDTPASIVRRRTSTIVFFSETAGKIYFKFGL